MSYPPDLDLRKSVVSNCLLARTSLLLGMASVLSLTACERSAVEPSEVPQDVEPAPETAAPTPPANDAPETAAQVANWSWTVPGGWTEDPEPRPMRLTTYIAPDPAGPVEVAVTRFTGRVGGELANINRWRGQLGLPPIDESGLEDAITRFSSPGFDGYQTRISSDGGVMLVSGVYEEAIDQTWFVRATVADAEIADRLEADLFAMARSIANASAEGDN